MVVFSLLSHTFDRVVICFVLLLFILLGGYMALWGLRANASALGLQLRPLRCSAL